MDRDGCQQEQGPACRRLAGGTRHPPPHPLHPSQQLEAATLMLSPAFSPGPAQEMLAVFGLVSRLRSSRLSCYQLQLLGGQLQEGLCHPNQMPGLAFQHQPSSPDFLDTGGDSSEVEPQEDTESL